MRATQALSETQGHNLINTYFLNCFLIKSRTKSLTWKVTVKFGGFMDFQKFTFLIKGSEQAAFKLFSWGHYGNNSTILYCYQKGVRLDKTLVLLFCAMVSIFQ